MPKKYWPPPGYPIVEGDHPITSDWSIFLPTKYARRIEEGDLVLWRPGLTIWLAVWNNDKHESRVDRLTSIKATASVMRFAERESTEQALTRYSYRLSETGENESTDSVYGFILNDDSQVEMAIYFDDPEEENAAHQLVESVHERKG